MFRLTRQVSVPVLRVSSKYLATANLPGRQKLFAVHQAVLRSGRILHVGSVANRFSVSSCVGCRANYSTGKELEKTPEAQASESAREMKGSSEESATSRSREPTNIERKIFVWTGKYKTVDEVPKLVSEAALMSAKSKFRIYINLGMGAATLIAAICMIIIGKSRAKKGESVSSLNIQRHPEAYGRMAVGDDAKK